MFEKRERERKNTMMKRGLTMEELEQVNGGGAKEVVEKILGFFLGGVIEETKNDVPH